MRLLAALLIWLAALGAAQAAQHVAPYVGHYVGAPRQFGYAGPTTGVPPAPPACGGFQGPGDIAPGAVAGVSIRAWTALNCGQKFANITVSGVSADMLTSASTGALVPQTINGSVCPNASTTLCVLTKWYDQTLGNNCTGSCDTVKTGTETLGVLTTTCPLPLTVCIVFPTSTSTFNQAAGNLTNTFPFSAMAFANYAPGGGANGTYIGLNNGGVGHASVANQGLISCDSNSFFTSSGVTDGLWWSNVGQCTSTTSQLFLNGVGQGLNAAAVVSMPQGPYVGGIFSSGPVIYETEAGIWNRDISASSPALNSNQRAFYGFVAPPDVYFATAGSDTQTCSQAQPCATIDKANSLNYTGGGSNGIHFNGGDTFTGCLSITTANASPSVANPMTINGYGTGRPTINTNCSGGFSAGLTLDTVRGVSVSGINFVQGGNSPPTMACILLINTAGVVQSGDYTIQNISCTGGFTSQGGGVSGLTGGGITIRGFTNGCAPINNVVLRNNTIFGAAVTSPDQNGIFGSDGCTGPGNLNNYTGEGNLCFNLGGTNPNTGTNPGNCILFIDGSNTLEQFNIAHDNAWNCTVSPGCGVSFWNDQVDNAEIRFSEGFKLQAGFSTAGTDFDCTDHDQGVTNSVIEYVYCHDNFGYGVTGVMAGVGGWGPNTVRYMITENDNARTGDLTAGLISFFNNGAPGLLYVYNNTIWANHTTSPTRTAGYANQSGWPAGGIFANNSISLTADSFGLFTPVACVNVDATTITQPFHHNDYNNLSSVTQQFYTCGPGGTNLTFAGWAAAITGAEASTIQTAPGFVGSPPDAACTWTPNTIVKTSSSWPPSGCAASVALASGAQNAKSVGANLANGSWPGGAPTRDFFLIGSVPGTGPCYNIGAYGTCP